MIAPIFTVNVPHITWLTPLGPTNSCLYAESSSSAELTYHAKVAAFDLDGTIIVPKSGKKFPEDHEDWRFRDALVLPRLKALHEEG